MSMIANRPTELARTPENYQPKVMKDRANEVTNKLDRAAQLIAQLHSLYYSWGGDSPVTVEIRRTGGHDSKIECFVTDVAEVPVMFGALAGDVFHNLVCALDHLAYQLVCVATVDPPDRAHTIYFPIAENEEKYRARRDRCLGRANPKVLEIIDAIQPYGGGFEHLYTLNRLNNLDKHRSLLTVAAASTGVSTKALMPVEHVELFVGEAGREAFPHLWIYPATPAYPLKRGDIILTMPDGPSPIFGTDSFQFDILFAETGIVDGVSVVDLVLNLYLAVHCTVECLLDHLRSFPSHKENES